MRFGGKRSQYEQRHRGWTRTQGLLLRGVLGREDGSVWIECRVRTKDKEAHKEFVFPSVSTRCMGHPQNP